MNTPTETWQHCQIVTNGIEMHYVTQGEGPLIVLLHGFPEFWYSWRWQIPSLASLGYRVVAPDLRGYNETDKPPTGYDVPTLVHDIVSLIKELGQEKAVLVGHDWGGALAWSLAARYPQMIERLIVLNAPPPWTFARALRSFKQLRKSWYIFFLQLPWLPEYLLGRDHAALVGKILYESAVQKSAFPPDVLARYRDAMSKPQALRAAITYYRAAFPFRGQGNTIRDAARESNVNAPTLLIWGEQDVALESTMTDGLWQWVPNLRIERLLDSGHWVQQEKPEQVNSLIAEFLKHA